MLRMRLTLPIALLLAACQAPALPPSTAVAPRPAASAASAASPSPTAQPTARPTATPVPTPVPTPTPTPAPLRLVALGASDVFGLGADEPATQGWAPVLAELLEARAGRALALTKVGVIARETADMRTLDVPKVVEAKPEVVVLWTGANDMRVAVPVESFRADLDAILAALAATGARIYVLDLPALDRLPFFREVKDRIAAELPGYQAAIRATAGKHGAKVIDLSSYSGEIDAHPEYLWFDGFHPSTQGYRRLAEIIAAVVGKDLAPAR